MSNPTLSSVSIVSNNSIKTNYAGENDIVTLSLVASENIINKNVYPTDKQDLKTVDYTCTDLGITLLAKVKMKI